MFALKSCGYTYVVRVAMNCGICSESPCFCQIFSIKSVKNAKASLTYKQLPFAKRRLGVFLLQIHLSRVVEDVFAHSFRRIGLLFSTLLLKLKTSVSSYPLSGKLWSNSVFSHGLYQIQSFIKR